MIDNISMKSNELQIGNWVKLNDPLQSGYAQISEIRKDKVLAAYRYETIGVNLEFIEPIPISPEWLRQNQFTKIGEADNYGIEVYHKELPDVVIEIRKNESNTIGRDWFLHIDNQDRMGIACADVQYVHHVQNLLNLMGIKNEFING